ncbi:MAG: glycosyltransferase family 9 protein [Xenococcaceae cyanobacterium MO_188.B32]|nr:glycosyltransferase family 9 protein [Xenococcaceae cyanobacterium MO_188.B32]
MRILALVPGGIGDQILFFPTLETLKEKYPQATIDVLVEPSAKAAYRVCKNVNEILTFNYRDRSSLADYLNLLGVIRDREYDVALSIGTRWAIGLLIWLNGIPTRIGYKGKSSWYLSHPVPLKSEQYIAYMYHDLVTGLGIHTHCPPVKINVPTADISAAEIEQKNLDIKDTGYILIYDSSSLLYPLDKWQKIVADIQQKQPDLPVVVLQTFGNNEWVSSIMQACPNLKAISPPDVGKLAAIIAGANLLLCPNSAVMHLSTAVNTYTIALIEPANANKFIPPDNENCISIQSPTNNIADIKPEVILEKIWQG